MKKKDDDNASFRAKIATLVAELKVPEKQAPMPDVSAKDLEPPKFLRRKLTKVGKERITAILRQINNPVRQWAPIRKSHEIAPRPSMPLMTDRPDLPVKVQVKGKEAGSTLLATYANMAEFEAKHNKATYPVKGQPMLFNNHNVILVTAKPWADKEKNAVKRVGPKASAVNVDGTVYDSVLVAFQSLHLPVSKHQKFRAELKQKRRLAFVHEGKEYAFTYDLDAKPAAKKKGKRK